VSKSKLINSQNSVTKQLERAKRQAILMRFVETNKNKPPSFDELAAMMREDPWVAARWPSYSHQTAHNDFSAVMGLVRDDIKDLAMPYFARQVDLMDGAINTLSEFSEDDGLSPKLRMDALNAMRGYLEMMGRVFGNFAPKETHIKRAEISINLDEFRRLKEQATKQLEVIDGEVID